MTKDFAGKVAVVTGAGSGIGQAVAERLAGRGAKVVVGDLDMAAAQSVVTGITEAGGTAVAFGIDVADRAANQAMVALAVSEYGGLNYAVNNAGMTGPTALFADYDNAAWDRVIAVNLSSVFHAMQAEIPEILKAGGGAIVNTASLAGLVGNPQMAGYGASKHGVVGLTKSAAMDYAAKGIRINAIAPGGVETPLLRGKGDEYVAGLAAAHPVGRLATPAEIAAFAVFLLSEEAGFMTGVAYVTDGGLSIGPH